jgi:hypothetical protein
VGIQQTSLLIRPYKNNIRLCYFRCNNVSWGIMSEHVIQFLDFKSVFIFEKIIISKDFSRPVFVATSGES